MLIQFKPTCNRNIIFEAMKLVCYIILGVFITVAISCTKTSFITSPGALVETSADTLHFDTVFTTTGSTTQSFKIFNQNAQKLRISGIQLAGGQASAFKINVDGTPGTSFSNIDIEPNDSIYVFVSVSINAANNNLPFIVQDSISINYNTNHLTVQLDAYGQVAHFMRNTVIDKDTTLNNGLPYVILGSLTVAEGKTLTITEGTKIYCHADAPIIINGTLKTEGEKYDSTKVTFQGDRLDEPYKNFPASWPGIVFTASSKDNLLHFAVVKNAYQAIVAAGPSLNSNPKVSLDECIIDNAYDAGVYGYGSAVYAENCLISNCGSNVRFSGGGNYYMVHCTVASYSNTYIDHKSPVLAISNVDDNNQPYPLTAHFINDIFWGDGGKPEDEIALNKQGAADFNVSFDHVLYKEKNQVAASLNGCIPNVDPQFLTIDVTNNYYDFHLQPSSPCLQTGINAGILTDLNGDPRSNHPSIGCYD